MRQKGADMNISYRTRQFIRRIATTGLTVAVVAALATVVGLLWVRRFAVYTDQGVQLQFSPKPSGEAVLPQPPDTLPTVPIHFDDSPFREGLSQLNGYYIAAESLMKDPSAVQDYLQNLPAGTPVMVDLKGYRGYFYYPSTVGLTTSGSYDMEKMKQFLSWLTDSNLYVIGRISTLRDFDYAYHDGSCGLALKSGALYSDRGSYGLGYWLDPTNVKVQNYLIQVVKEIRGLGFDEVVLQNFCFPETDSLAFTGDKAAALQGAANVLIAACRTEEFTLSFSGSDPGFQLPDELCRLYLEDIPPENAQSAWDDSDIEDKRVCLVFITPGTDTRYELENGILRTLNIVN